MSAVTPRHSDRYRGQPPRNDRRDALALPGFPIDDIADLQFDNVLGEALTYLGVNSAIVFLVKLAFVIESWAVPARMAWSGLSRVHGAAAQGLTVVRGVPGVRRIALAVSSMLVLIGQALSVGLCFLVGNWLSLALGQHAIPERSDGDPVPTPVEQALDAITVDWVSAAYAVLAVSLLAMSYSAAWRGRDTKRLAGVMAFPAVLILPLLVVGGVVLIVITVLGFLFVLLLDLLSEASPSAFLADVGAGSWPLLAGIAACALFWITCRMALSGSGLVVRMWSGRTNREATTAG